MDPKRKFMRAVSQTLTPTHRPIFMVGKLQFAVRNISSEGLGIWLGAHVWSITDAGSAVQGSLIFSGKEYPCEMGFVHHSGTHVGLRFVTKNKKLEANLKEILEPSAQAGGVIPHPLNLSLDEETNERVLWYEGINGSSLRVWFNEQSGLITQLRVSFAGKEFGRNFQGPLLSSQPSAEEGSEKFVVQQFLAALPFPLPGILLWQFLETGEQIYLPEKTRQPKQVA